MDSRGKKALKVFRSAQEIIEYYDMSRNSFEAYIKMGMPARLINHKWHGSADNIDEFFRRLTVSQTGDCPNQRPSPIPEPGRREARQKSLLLKCEKQQFVLAHLRREVRDLLLDLTMLEEEIDYFKNSSQRLEITEENDLEIIVLDRLEAQMKSLPSFSVNVIQNLENSLNGILKRYLNHISDLVKKDPTSRKLVRMLIEFHIRISQHLYQWSEISIKDCEYSSWNLYLTLDALINLTQAGMNLAYMMCGFWHEKNRWKLIQKLGSRQKRIEEAKPIIEKFKQVKELNKRSDNKIAREIRFRFLKERLEDYIAHLDEKDREAWAPQFNKLKTHMESIENTLPRKIAIVDVDIAKDGTMGQMMRQTDEDKEFYEKHFENIFKGVPSVLKIGDSLHDDKEVRECLISNGCTTKERIDSRKKRRRGNLE